MISNNDISNTTINSTSPFAISNFSSIVFNKINKFYDGNYDELLIVCIGTDRSTGDCLGPLIGHKLCNIIKKYSNVHIYGTLDQPVHAKNLSETIDEINSSYNNPFIIAIDACLGKHDRIGYVTIHEGPLNPGAGVNKNLPKIGDIHITGVVNMSGFMEYVILQNTRLSTVMKMANVISSSINHSLWKLFSYNKSTNLSHK